MGTVSFSQLREAYKVFVYHGFTYQQTSEGVDITFHFDIPGLTSFSPSLQVPGDSWDIIQDPSSSLGQAFVYSIGLVELVSYWKSVCSPVILLPGALLDDKQIEFWHNLYYDGLGEFFFTNGIDVDREDMVTILDRERMNESYNESIQRSLKEAGIKTRSAGTHDVPLDLRSGAFADVPSHSLNRKELLIPVGGGKDSIVSLERLSRQREMKRLAFALNPTEAVRASIRTAGIHEKDTRFVRRFFDSELLDLNRRGFLNGHTPFSALIAFVGAYVAWLGGQAYVVLSNESSASESTVRGRNVNHQYSKSAEFELAVSHYLQTYLSPELKYFSFLRPVSEIAIARDFAQYTDYHEVFRSCNKGSKTDSWCGQCPKCLFVWLILSPFMKQKTLEKIWGRDLWSESGLAKTLQETVGMSPVKPFECVGTVAEASQALGLVLNRKLAAAESLPLLLEQALQWIKADQIEHLVFEDGSVRWTRQEPSPLESWETGHQGPEQLLPLLEGINRPYSADEDMI